MDAPRKPTHCPDCGTRLSEEAWAQGLCVPCLAKLAADAPSLHAELLDPDEASTLVGKGLGLAPGQILGQRYRIHSLLGRGGMGDVWRAFDLKLRVDVALKALRPERLGTERGREILRNEVRAARQVVSPNVCRVFDLVELDGHELVSMEYVDGETLTETVEDRGPLALDEAREIASQFLAGLAAIHAAGLVHRDFKPDNVMLTPAGRVVVMDFGIARALTEGVHGTISGTPAYMAPEQARGDSVDARADVFSVGVVLAEMISVGGNGRDEARAIWRDVRKSPPVVPESPWQAVIARSVAASADERYASAAALARALEEVTSRVEGSEELHPYPGLSSFTAENAEYFFGREREVEAMSRKLRHPRLLALIGPSGAGKTSFLRAGLLASLPEGWSAISSSPGSRPFANLGRALADELANDTDAMRDLLLFEEPDVAVSLVSRWRGRHEHALIVIDQFEELFTQNRPEVQASFAELCGRLALDADVHVLLSMRDDFLFQCQSQPPLAPIFSELTPLGPLTGSGLRRALVQPALKCGYRFEDDTLVEDLVAEVRDERGALPLLAFTAARLWELRDRDQGLLTREAYEHVGGVGGALAQHAEATLDRIGQERVPIARELFRNLVTAQGTRAVRERDELLSVFGEHRDAADAVLRSLIDARLLTSYEVTETGSDGDEPRQRVEIIHESLLKHWPRLVRWQSQDADSALLRDQLRQAAQLWEERGRPDDLLWTQTSYREYALWRERYQGGLTAVEEEFARAMTARAERRRRRRRIALSVALTGALGIATVFGGLWKRAEDAAQRAEAEKLLAMGQARLEDSPTHALAYITKSLELADSYQSRRAAVDALAIGPPATVYDMRRDGVTEAVAHDAAFSPDGAWAALMGFEQIRIVSRDGQTVRKLERFQSGRGNARAAFDPSGRYLYGAKEGQLRVWSVPDFEVVESHTLTSGRAWIVASPEAAYTESWIESGTVAVSRYVVGEPPRELGRVEGIDSGTLDESGRWFGFRRDGATYAISVSAWNDGPKRVGRQSTVTRFRFDTYGERLATLDDAERVTIFSLSPIQPEPLAVLEAPEIRRLYRFDPGGTRLAGDPSADMVQVALWELDAPRATRPRRFPARVIGGSGIASARFTPGGQWLTTAAFDAVMFWPLEQPGPRILSGDAAGIRGVRFLSDGRRLVTVANEEVAIWDLASGRRTRTISGVPTAAFPKIEVGPHEQDEEWVAVSAVGGVAIVPLSGGPIRRLEGFDPTTVVGQVAIDGAGRRIAIAGLRGPPGDMGIRVWDLETDETTFLPVPGESTGGEVGGVAFLPDGSLVSVGTYGLAVWNVSDGSSRVIAEGYQNSYLTVFGEGRYVASMRGTHIESRLQITDLESETTRVLPAHGSRRTEDVVVDPAEQLIVSAGTEEALTVGAISGGAPHFLTRDVVGIIALDISPDGRWVAASDVLGDTLTLFPVPDVSETPLQALPYDELLAKLRSLTNLRVVEDPEAPTGWTTAVDPFPGWETPPTW